MATPNNLRANALRDVIADIASAMPINAPRPRICIEILFDRPGTIALSFIPDRHGNDHVGVNIDLPGIAVMQDADDLLTSALGAIAKGLHVLIAEQGSHDRPR